MPKKTAHWITIPDEKLHTPVADAGENQKVSKPVKNKWFWGIAFVVVIVVTFALLAPNQFNELLRGSLFDAPGVGSPVASPMDLLEPDNSDQEETLEEAAPEEPVEAEEEGVYEEEPVVQPEEEAVSISVEPISEPEEIVIEPVGPEVEDCGKDVPCFVAHLADCSLAKVSYSYEAMGQAFEADLEITGEEAGHCLVDAMFTKSPALINLTDKEAHCKLEKGEYTEASLQAKFSDPNEVLSKCSGSAISVLEQYSALLETTEPEPEAPTEEDAQAQLIEELAKQVEQLQQQRELDIKTMEDLAKSAAPTPTVPPSVTTTTTFGQPPAVQPGFRPNPYTVAMTPEQMLMQNQAIGVQVAQAPVVQPQPAYQAPAVAATPDSGPSDILFIVFTLAFLGLVSWKFIRVFA